MIWGSCGAPQNIWHDYFAFLFSCFSSRFILFWKKGEEPRAWCLCLWFWHFDCSFVMQKMAFSFDLTYVMIYQLVIAHSTIIYCSDLRSKWTKEKNIVLLHCLSCRQLFYRFPFFILFFFLFYEQKKNNRFDTNKSTKGASKLRRDLINTEIANLRDLLPLPQSTRQRLSQLQLMALVCVYVRKANYFQQGKY